VVATLAEFFATLFSALARQVVLGFGLIALLGAVLLLLRKESFRFLSRAIGYRGVILWTGWLGTPIHEISHVLVGKLFLIKIHEVKLFEPDAKNGVLGYVRYEVPRLEPKNLYSVVGTFFMGVAPLFGGSLVLLLALLLLAPRPDLAFDAAGKFAALVESAEPAKIGGGFLGLLQGVYGAVFSRGVADVRPWLFLYVALAVGSHLAPSRADLEGGLTGLVVLLVLAFFANAVALLLGFDPRGAAEVLSRWTGPIAALLVVALALCAGNTMLAVVLAWLLPDRRESA